MLTHEKFAYKNLVNRSTGMSPFQTVSGRSLHGVTNLAELLIGTRKSANEKSFVDHMKEVHDKGEEST